MYIKGRPVNQNGNSRSFPILVEGLFTAVSLLSALSVPAFRGKKWMVAPAYVLGLFMLLNGCGRIAGSVHLGGWHQGAILLLLAGVIIFLVATHR